MKLYEVSKEIEACIKYGDDYVNTETGEIFDKEAFEQLNLDRETKREQCALLIKNTEAEADMVKAEIEKLTRREKTLRNTSARVREYLAFDLNGEKFKTAKVDIGWRKSEIVVITDVNKVPEQYLRTKTAITTDKVQIKKDLKNGIEIAGATLEVKNNIQIK